MSSSAAAEEDGDTGMFDQQIPVRLELADNENLSPEPVKPVYLMAPRQSYLPALALQVLPSFAHVLPPVLAPPSAAAGSAEEPADPAAAAAAEGDGGGAAPPPPPPPPKPLPRPPPSPWLDYEGLPLKGNLPVGVLFDLIAAPVGSDDADDDEEEEEGEEDEGAAAAAAATATRVAKRRERRAAALAAAAPAAGLLPWRLTLHYRLLPPGGRAAWSGGWENDVPPREHWLGALKEAAFCLAGGADGARAVMRLSGDEQDALWAAAARGDALAYARAAEPLGLAPVARHGAAPCVPVRVLIRPAAPSDGGPDPASSPPSSSIWERTYATSRPIPVLVPLEEGGQEEAAAAPPPPPFGLAAGGDDDDDPARAQRPPTPTRAALLADALHIVAPALFPAEVVEQALGKKRRKGGGGGGRPPAGEGPPPAPPEAPRPPRPPAVLVGGVLAPLSCPLAWLHARLCGPDAFLYVVVRCR